MPLFDVYFTTVLTRRYLRPTSRIPLTLRALLSLWTLCTRLGERRHSNESSKRVRETKLKHGPRTGSWELGAEESDLFIYLIASALSKRASDRGREWIHKSNTNAKEKEEETNGNGKDEDGSSRNANARVSRDARTSLPLILSSTMLRHVLSNFNTLLTCRLPYILCVLAYLIGIGTA